MYERLRRNKAELFLDDSNFGTQSSRRNLKASAEASSNRGLCQVSAPYISPHVISLGSASRPEKRVLRQLVSLPAVGAKCTGYTIPNIRMTMHGEIRARQVSKGLENSRLFMYLVGGSHHTPSLSLSSS